MRKTQSTLKSRRMRMERLEERSMLAVSVLPNAQTAAGSGADDIAIWIHPTDPSKSTIIGSLKTNASSLRVYDLSGQQIQSVAEPKVNNLDLRDNFSLGGQNVAIVTGSNRSNDSICVYAVDSQTGLLSNVAARTISTNMKVYGLTMYVSPVSGKYYTIAVSESGQVQEWELFDNGAGKVDAALVRSFNVGSITEGMVADDVTGYLYVGEENVGIWRYSAEPNGGSNRISIDTTGSSGHLSADVEGLTIYYTPNGGGYLLASSQGSNEFAVYRRDGNNAYLGSFNIPATVGIDAVSITDGIDVTNFSLGPQYPFGMFVAQDNDQNFKMVRWDAIASAFGGLLDVNTSWDPRLIGGGSNTSTNQVPQVNAGADQSIALDAAAQLDGTVTDDGLPLPSELTYTWEQVSGTGTANFANVHAIDTTATFTTVGDYELRLTASDGSLPASDLVTVHVTSTPPSPTPTSPQTVVFQDGVAGYSGTRDTSVWGNKTSKNYGTKKKLDASGSKDHAMLISWDVSSISSTAIVESAQIDLQVLDKSATSFPVFAVNRQWDERQATWTLAAQGNNWGTAGVQDTSSDRGNTQIGVLNTSGKGAATITLNAAGIALVQSWIENPAANFGIIIQNYDGTAVTHIASREAKSRGTAPETERHLLRAGAARHSHVDELVYDHRTVCGKRPRQASRR